MADVTRRFTIWILATDTTGADRTEGHSALVGGNRVVVRIILKLTFKKID